MKSRTAKFYPQDSGKWQADIWPVGRTISAGSLVSQSAWAFQQRVRKRHPEGGLTGDGTSPSSMIRFRDRSVVGLAMGTADSKAFV